MKRTFAALALAAVLLPGCYFIHKAVPLDASGMEYPAHEFAVQFQEQVRNSGAAITGFPGAISRNFRVCSGNLTHDPSEY